jgi:lipopolysaccharide biosynthesis regulator YciM
VLAVSLRVVLLLALLFGIAVAYLTSVNAGGVRVALARDWAYEAPVVALVVGAFLVGACLALALSAVRDLARSLRARRRARQAQREQSLNESYQRGVDAQLAGQPDDAVRAYDEVLRREPGHARAALRLGEIARARGDAESALGHDMRALRAEERPETMLAVAEDYRRLGRPDEVSRMYHQLLARDPDDAAALRGLREVAAQYSRWDEAQEAQERLLRNAPRGERAAEEAWLAAIHYERGRALLADGRGEAAIAHLKEALRARPDFLPATVLLGDAHERAGEPREALRAWERVAETQPAAPLLARIEQRHRAEGRPTRMIALYERAAARHPDDLAVAFGLGRVYFELAMLDEAAEQFEKLEVRAPDSPGVHAFLGAVFERRGEMRQACEEYRRALKWNESLEWPHRCSACGAAHPSWTDRCPTCRRWNTSRP